jgi:hypothetical protein
MSNASTAVGILVGLVIVVGSTIWVAIDSRSLRRRGLDHKPEWVWVLECLLLWIVFFPWYVIHRYRVLQRHPDTPLGPTNWPTPSGRPPPGFEPLQPPPRPAPVSPPIGYTGPSGMAQHPPPPSAEGMPRRGFSRWSILLLVLGCFLVAAALIDVFTHDHLVTVGHGTVDCGSIAFPRAVGNVVSRTGTTCRSDLSGLLTGAIIIFVVGVVLIAASLVRRARSRRHR